MKCAFLLLLASCAFSAAGKTAAEAAKDLQHADLDHEECYRVRDVTLAREDVRFYLTDGFLIFGKPVGGRRVSAVFTAETEGGDAEVLLIPPHRSERQSLASFTQSPNLDEHLNAAIFIFTDGTGEELLAQIRAGSPKKALETGHLLADKWNPVVRNITTSFEIRLVQDQFTAQRESQGFFFAAVSGKQLGNFDVLLDPRAREQITVGQVTSRDNSSFFDVWTSFRGRSWRKGDRAPISDELTVSDIRIEATLQPNLHLKAITRMKVSAAQGQELVLPFELSRRMRVTKATFDGAPVEFFMRDSLRANLQRSGDNDLFLVVTPKPLEPGRIYEVEFQHEGDVISSAGNDVYYVGARGNWYPNRGGGFSNYDVTFRYPKELDLVATGDITETKEDGEWRVTRRRTSAPVRFSGFNLGSYERVSASKSGFTVEVYANRNVEKALQQKPHEPVIVTPSNPFPRGIRRGPQEPVSLAMGTEHVTNPAARMQEIASEIASAMEFMSANFGPPPLKLLTVSPIPGAFGQGFPGLLYLSTLSYLDPRQLPATMKSDQLFYGEILQAHEAAHQWWGNMVTSGSYQDDWLMEALANYSALMYLEKRHGRKALDTVLEQYRAHLLSKTEDGRRLESAGPIVWGLRLRSSQVPSGWKAVTYEKGSWIMHMLRGRLGDAAFLKMLGVVADRYRRKQITTEDFERIAAGFLPPKSADPKLESFFEQWVYGTGVPTLKVSTAIGGKLPALKLQGTVSQKDVDDDFSALVPVEIQLPMKHTITKWVQTSSEPVTFTLDLKQRPLKVVLDPANTILAIRN